MLHKYRLELNSYFNSKNIEKFLTQKLKKVGEGGRRWEGNF